MSLFSNWRFALSLLLGSSLLIVSCKKTEDVTPVVTTTAADTTNVAINNWILANMQYYYLWNDKIPANPDKSLAPDKFFNSLLYDYTNTANINRDRFSYIRSTVTAITSSLNGQSKSLGAEYRYYQIPSGSIYALVIYVLPGSPAAKAGIKRGDIIAKVNGETLNTSNYSTALRNSDTYSLEFATVSNGTLTSIGQSKQVTAVDFQVDPVLMDSTYSVGGKTVGYIVYNQFIPGVAKSDGTTDNTFDNKLDNIFGKFKQKGVNELVLDFRYNPGGYVSSSTNLASLIVKNADDSKAYYAQQWNNNLNSKYGTTQNFLNKANNIGSSLSRVFILTSNGTASASELVINGLKPYMTVTTLGTTTYGKNVGSITVYDKTGNIKWAMQPITFKSANALGFSDYASGFAPAVEIKEPSSGLRALGDLTEPLLNEAVYQITGNRFARRATAPTTEEAISLGSSLDQKVNELNMVVTPNR